MDANLTGAVDLLKVVGKGVVDPGDKPVQLGLPFVHETLNVLVQTFELLLRRRHFPLQSLDLSSPPLKLPDDVGVGRVYELQLGLLGVGLHLEILRSPALADPHDHAPPLVALVNHHLLYFSAQFQAHLPVLLSVCNGFFHDAPLLLQTVHDVRITSLQAVNVGFRLDDPYTGFEEGIVGIGYLAERVGVLQRLPRSGHGSLVPLVL